MKAVETTPHFHSDSVNSSGISTTPAPPHVSYTLRVTVYSRPAECCALQIMKGQFGNYTAH